MWVKQGEKGLQTTGAYRGMKHYVYCALNLHQSQDKDHQQYKDDLCTPITSIPEGTSFANETEDTFYKNRFNNVLEIIGKLIWSDNKVNEVVKTCESLYTETGIYVDPRLVMAIIINEGTCSFNTYPNIKPKGSDKGNVADANFDRDVQRGLENIVWGKHAAFGTYSLAYKQRIGFGYPAPADIFSYINHSTPYGHLVRWRAGTVHEYSQNDRGTYPISIFPYAQNVGQAKALRDTFGVLCGDATGYAAIRYSNYVATYQLKSPYFPFSSLYPQYAGWLPGDTIPDEWKYIDHTDAINPSGYGAGTQTAQKSSFAFILGPNTNNNASEARWSVGYINADNATYTHSWDYYQKVPESDKKYDG